jgi:tape measure domain-containing protein
MQMDNRGFESKVASTVGSLDKLKQSLNFGSASNGLEEVQGNINRLSFQSMASSLEDIASRFTAMGAIAFSVLNNVVNKAVDAGIRLGKALSLDQVISGFGEYETNMNSIQTILANTQQDATSLEDVNGALDTLNEYSDKTIYNFSEMARNVGTFTAAGVDLDTSTQAIKGIANLAAISGSNSQQASTAMYQLSQAIASGSVKLMDWNSVVNAGMGGEVFQRALFETGKAMGTIQGVDMSTTFDEWTAAGNTFRNSLSGQGEEVESEATKIQRANEESSKVLTQAQERAAEVTEQAAKRVTDAKENEAETFKNTSEAIQNSIDEQQNVIKSNALAIERAMQDVVDARKRLDEAMKPTSEDDLEAANDRLTAAQLDQADVSRAVEEAQTDQRRASQDLKKAQEAYQKVLDDPTSSMEDIQAAGRVAEDANQRVIDISDAVDRARLRQNATARDLRKAEEELTEVQNKGSDTDENVINAKENLVSAEQALIDTKEQALKDEQAAADRITEVVENSKKRQVEASERVAEAEKANAKTIVQAQEDIAKATEDAAKIIEQVTQGSSPPSWLTSDVLTQTLSTFTGELTKEQLLALGYTDQQADEFLKLGESGVDAATKVKTLTQLLGTIKESIGSGWAKSFRLIFGDFDQAKLLFTDINNAIGEIVQKGADKRNTVLEGWQKLGGRDKLIQGIKDLFSGLYSIVRAVSSAFRVLFPAQSANSLFKITSSFAEMANKLANNKELFAVITRVARAFFTVLRIGWEVIKGVVGVAKDLFDSLFGGFKTSEDNGILGFILKIADKISSLNALLIQSGGISDFFDNISQSISNFIGNIKLDGIAEAFKDAFDKVAEVVGGFFSRLFGGDDSATDFGTSPQGQALNDLTASLERFSDRGKTLGSAWDRLVEKTDGVRKALGKFADAISGGFSAAWDKLVGAFSSPGNFEKTLDLLNTGIFGALVVFIGKFATGGFDIGGGFFENINEALQQVTGTLEAMQANIKAQALLRIAAAIGVLAVAILVLSLIDSAALTKAMIAIAVGFGLLASTLLVLNKISSGAGSAAAMATLAFGLILLAGAILVLSIAVKIMSSMNLAEMTQGLLGVTVLLGGLVLVVKQLDGIDKKGLLRTGLALIAIAVGLAILAVAVKLFSMMSFEDMVQGLGGVGVALAGIVLAMNKMPAKGMLQAGLGIIAIATGLAILAGAIAVLGFIPQETLIQGLIGIAGALAIVTIAANLMPGNLALIGLGMLAIGVGIAAMAAGIVSLALLSWEGLLRGLVGLGSALIILGIAAYAMEGAIPGAIAIGVMSVSMLLLAKALKKFSSLSWGELIKGLVGIAAVLAVLAISALLIQPALLPMLALAGVLILLGAGFALFGAGAYLVAAAFALLAESGTEGIAVLVEVLTVLLELLPTLATALAEAIIDIASAILDAAPEWATKFGELLGALFDAITIAAPKMGEAIKALIDTGLDVVTEKADDIVAAGLELLTTLLQGISDNIGEITKAVADIIVEFTTALAGKIDDIVAAGLTLLTNFLNGIANNIGKVAEAVWGIIEEFGKQIIAYTDDIFQLGLDFLGVIFDGIIDSVSFIGEKIREFIILLAGEFVKTLETAGLALTAVLDAGVAFIGVIFDGIVDATEEISDGIQKVIVALATAFIDNLETAGIAFDKVVDAGVAFVGVILDSMLDGILELSQKMIDFVVGLLNGMADVIREGGPQVRSAAKNLADALFDEIKAGLTDLAPDLTPWDGWVPFVGASSNNIVGALSTTLASNKNKKTLNTAGAQMFTNVQGGFNKQGKINSPSRVFMEIGGFIIAGLRDGIRKDGVAVDQAKTTASNVIGGFNDALTRVRLPLDDLENLSPRITPVVDLTNIQRSGREIDGLLSRTSGLNASVSSARALSLAQSTRAQEAALANAATTAANEIKFEQNVYAPTELSVGELYRQTRSQLQMAKEELGVP